MKKASALSNQLLDLDFQSDFIWTGRCLKFNKQILLLHNFDATAKKFDGFTIFRSGKLSRYRL